jgi:FixJ family two-component response regulator
MNAPGNAVSTVFVVDDDVHARHGLQNLLQSVGLHVEAYASASEFLEQLRPDSSGCLVLDVRLPGLSGLDLQDKLNELKVDLPIVFISGYGDVPMTVRAMKAGAVEFLTKPVNDRQLIEAVHIALDRGRDRLEAAAAAADLRARFATLTKREREIVVLVMSGKRTKQVAAELDLSEFTIKAHRRAAMRKLGATSAADLVRIADTLGIRL